MKQKKRGDEPRQEETEQLENCVKCAKLQNGGNCSYEDNPQSKQSTLGSLKSVLKRSSSHKKASKNQEKIVQKEVVVTRKSKNRVTFDESQNKYFDADYVILIHEEEYDFDDYYDEGSPYDDEDDDVYDEESSLAGHNMCCSNPNCNNIISFSYPFHPGGQFLPKERFDYDAHYYEDAAEPSRSSEYDKCHGCDDVYDVEVEMGGDHVTLSPPEGYKDGGCCPYHPQLPSQPPFHRQDYATSRDIGETKSNGGEVDCSPVGRSQDGTSTDNEIVDPKTEVKQRFIVETITMTTVTERRIVREAEDISEEAGKRSGILKGGKFWKNSTEKQPEKTVNYNEIVDYKESEQIPEVEEISTSFTVDEEGNGNEDQNDKIENATESLKSSPNVVDSLPADEKEGTNKKQEKDDTTSPDSTELTLTFKLGQHVLVANSLKPNSAVRQLFPSPRFLSPPPQDENDENADSETATVPPKQFLVTAESLRLFEEAKNSKILGNINEKESGQSFIAIMPPSSDEDLRVRRTIERNTLRRSLIRYPCDLRTKRMAAEKKKNENSLEERIRQLTCDIEDDYEVKPQEEEEEMPARASPQGEEAAEDKANSRTNESSSPSSNSSSSSSAGSTYKKITEVFARNNFPPPIMEDVNCNIKSDLVAAHEKERIPDNYSKYLAPKTVSRISVTTEARKQFLSTLAPLTACVGNVDGKEYSLEDIDAALKSDEPKIMSAKPDVIAGTPQNETPADELALFVQQDAGRIEKLKKRYSIDEKSDDEDDYGFNKRPQVKGIKPRFGTTQEIVQQIQENHTVWPYYSQGNNYQQAAPRPSFLNRSPSIYSSNSSLYQCQPMRIGGGGYPEIQNFHFRHPPQSPPPGRHRVVTPQPSPNPDGEAATRPLVVPRQTDGVVRNPESVFYRRTVPNVHNPCVQMQFSPVGYTVPAASIRFSATCAPRPVVDESKVIIEPHYSTFPRPQVIRMSQGQQMIRVPVPYASGAPVQVHLMARRCDSPQRPHSPQYLIAKGTQTAHHLPDGAPAAPVDFEAQGKAIAEELQQRNKLSRNMMSQDGGYQLPRPVPRPVSPTCGRGVPEGAASCPTQDAHIADPVSGNTVFYSMNV